jgi:hypothetical protein
MGYAIAFPVLKFNKTAEYIRKMHPYTKEIPLMDMKDEVQELLSQIDRLDENKMADYVLSLPNSDLVLIFHALLYDISSLQRERLLFILSQRMKKRFFHYNWIMLQEHYTNASLIESFILLMKFMKEKYPIEYNRSLASKLSFPRGDLVNQALMVLDEEQCTLSDFLKRYSFIEGSALSGALLETYFLQCSKEGFHKNADLFIKWINTLDSMPYSQIIHYLDVMSILDFVEDINNYLIEIIGLPGQSEHWNKIEKRFQTKFLKWIKFKDLGKYLGLNTDKFVFWNDYYHYVEKVECYPELGILFLHLPGHVVVDLKENSSTSYLYKNNIFHAAYEQFDTAGGFEGKSSWPLESEESIEPIKNAILENNHSEIYELIYEGMGKLYIRDYLESYCQNKSIKLIY